MIKNISFFSREAGCNEASNVRYVTEFMAAGLNYLETVVIAQRATLKVKLDLTPGGWRICSRGPRVAGKETRRVITAII